MSLSSDDGSETQPPDAMRRLVVDLSQRLGALEAQVAELRDELEKTEMARATLQAENQRLIALTHKPGKFHGFGEKLLKTYLAPQNLSNAAMASRVRGMTERLGPDVFVRQSLIARPGSRATLRALGCPVLVLCAEHDALTPPALHRDIAIQIPWSQLEIVQDAGHMTPIEQPEAVSTALPQLLSR